MGEATGLDVHLHPLVLINISDHVVRFKHTGQTQRVLGAMIGAQEGRRVDVHNSFELLVSGMASDADPGFDLDFFKSRLAQYMEVFPKYEFLGWYSVGTCPQESDKPLHKKMQEVSANETPFVLLLDSTKLGEAGATQSEELPVKVWDSSTQLDQGVLKFVWNDVPYAIDTLEAERIAVNHVAKSATALMGGHSSDFTKHTSGLSNSVVMLNNRVKELLEYMKEVKAGRAPRNHDVLRQMLSICQALQASHRDSLQDEFCGEFNDGALVVLLASLTKASANTSDLLDKFQLAHDKKHRHRYHPFG